MSEIESKESLEPIFQRVRDILAEARSRAWRAVNAAMVAAYWEVGRAIVEEEQKGAAKAAYGERLLEQLSWRLTAEFGKGFTTTNLKNYADVLHGIPDSSRSA